MKILITGGSGLLGRYITDHLARVHDVSILDLKYPHRKDLPFLECDILHRDKTGEACKGFDAVVHLAGIPHPLNEPWHKVFDVNTRGTYNVMEASAEGGVRRLIFMSSESTLGFAFSTRDHSPKYFPVDESHPTVPQDAYGLSKVAGEAVTKGIAERFGITAISLRAPWVWVPEPTEIKFYKTLITEYQKWKRNLWAFVHVLDLASAVESALHMDMGSSHECFFICSDDQWTERPTRELLAQFYPNVGDLRLDYHERESLISNEKAHRMLAWNPRYNAKDIVGV